MKLGVGVVLLTLAVSVVPAAAQTDDAAPSPAIQLFSRFDFRLGAEHLSSREARFVWDTNFGGDIDVLDYRRGRATFEANYQAILGEEFKEFDPNQGNYILTGVGSYRTRGVEIAAVLYHQSRHLGDRFNRQAVDWNMLGGRIRGAQLRPRVQMDWRVDLRRDFKSAFVDYTWELDSAIKTLTPVGPGLVFFTGGGLRLLGVDGSRDRGTQHGWRGETGLRVEGRGAAAELFLAGERRIDPYPLESSTATWLTLGFRLVSR